MNFVKVNTIKTVKAVAINATQLSGALTEEDLM